MSEAVLILGDQLNLSLSSLQAAGPDAEIFMAEVEKKPAMSVITSRKLFWCFQQCAISLKN